MTEFRGATCDCCQAIRKIVMAEDQQNQYQGLQEGLRQYKQIECDANAFTIENGHYTKAEALYDGIMRFCPSCGANIARRIRQWKGIPSYPSRKRRKQDDQP